MGWRRWFKYGKAKVESAARDLDRTVARKEAELEADGRDKPWLADDDDVPTFEETKARIEHEAHARAPSGDPAFDLAAQKRAADERLAKIRESLDAHDKKPPAG